MDDSIRKLVTHIEREITLICDRTRAVGGDDELTHLLLRYNGVRIHALEVMGFDAEYERLDSLQSRRYKEACDAFSVTDALRRMKEASR